MVFGWLTGLLFAAIMSAGIALSCLFAYKGFRSRTKNYGTLKLAMIPVAIVGFVLLLFIPGSFHTVESGEIAVVKHLGKVTGTRTAGTYFDFWMTDYYQVYDAKVQNINIETETYSSDAQTMDIQMTIQYQIDPTKVVEIATNYGSLATLENRIESVSIEQMKSVLAEYTAADIIAQRAAMSPSVSAAVRQTITENYYVTITTVVLTDISFSDAYENAVEQQMVAEREKAAAITRAEQQLEVARIEADARLAAARGEADAQKAIAEAEAYTASIKIIELARTLGYDVTTSETEDGFVYSITWGDDEKGKELILSYLKYLEYLAKWNGELPGVVAGDSLDIFIPAQ